MGWPEGLCGRYHHRGPHLLWPGPLRLRANASAARLVREFLLRLLGVRSLDVRGGPLDLVPSAPPHRLHRDLLLPILAADAVEPQVLGGLQGLAQRVSEVRIRCRA